MTSPEKLASIWNVPVELVPVLPELLADIRQLGSWPEKIATLLASTDLPEDSEIIELGCGKGAVTIEIARRLKRRVTGVDLFAPFLEEAERYAEQAGVAHLCTFMEADIQTVVRSPGRIYDAVVLAAVGPLGKTYAETIDKLRRMVRSGGYLVIDDGFVTDSLTSPYAGYEYGLSRQETTEALCSNGDRLLREIIVPKGELIAYNAANNESIAKRAAAIIERSPGLRVVVEDFVRSELEECRYMEACTEAAIWLLEKK